MTFRSDFQGVQRDIITELGEPVTFSPAAGGDPITTLALIERVVQQYPSDFVATINETFIEISLLVEDVGVPFRGDQILSGAVTYFVDSLNSNNGIVAKVLVHA